MTATVSPTCGGAVSDRTDTRNSRIAFVDALRGIAILAVVLVHCSQQAVGAGKFVSVATFGQYGVQLFFVISAITLTVAGRHQPYVLFMLRRYMRIAPMYLCALVLFFAITLALEKTHWRKPFFTPTETYSIPWVLANIAMIHGFIPGANNLIVPGGWSIGCEFAFYALLPWLTRFSANGFSKAAIVSLGLWITFHGLTVLFEIPNTRGFLYFNILNQIPCFVAGIWLARNYLEIPRIAAFLVGATAVFALARVHSLEWGWRVTPVFAAGCSMAAVILLRSWSGFAARCLSWVGRLSFSIYCLHYAIVRLLGDALWDWLVGCSVARETAAFVMFAVVFSVSAVAAATTYFAIEVPMIKAGRKLEKWLESSAGSVGPTRFQW